ncbi:uncharacterized protein OCT59_018005 [Rhizophagus irregularis]|uniref:uncharacterized protein n=1 Tax=Rhizophagus irregularis TaxID=588596 RepID=UPI001C138246|nr:hypothetical protein OCT59_018005 [Rhizophagus irregularis]CAB4475966.1 unnamed protein product [Rhizophagus irregularis]
MEIINNYYNEFNQLKTRNASISKTFVTTKEEILDEIFRDSDGKDKDISIHLIQLFEQKNKVINNTFILTENVLKLLRRKELLCYRDKLKKVLDKVNITKVEFELLFKMKHTSNNEFYQNEIRTLEQDLKNLDVDFPNDLKDLKVPLKKFELNSLNQHNFNTFFTSSPICSIQFN